MLNKIQRNQGEDVEGNIVSRPFEVEDMERFREMEKEKIVYRFGTFLLLLLGYEIVFMTFGMMNANIHDIKTIIMDSIFLALILIQTIVIIRNIFSLHHAFMENY